MYELGRVIVQFCTNHYNITIDIVLTHAHVYFIIIYHIHMCIPYGWIIWLILYLVEMPSTINKIGGIKH